MLKPKLNECFSEIIRRPIPRRSARRAVDPDASTRSLAVNVVPSLKVTDCRVVLVVSSVTVPSGKSTSAGICFRT